MLESASAAGPGPAAQPQVSVVVPAIDAAATTIQRTLHGLAAQDLDAPYEVIVALDGPADRVGIAVRAAFPAARVLSDPQRRGPGAARNHGAAQARAPALAFTDADCEPAPSWLRLGLEALRSSEVVQGSVLPRPDQPRGPWDRTIIVEGETGLFETANMFVRADLFQRLGGFEDWLDTGGKPIAEDLWFGWQARRAGARIAFRREVLVHHEVYPRGFLEYVTEHARRRFFCAMAREFPELRSHSFFGRYFLDPRTAAFDAALAGAAAAAATRSPWPLIAAAPYLSAVRRAGFAFDRRDGLKLAVAAVPADAVSLAALLWGSLRYRALVL